MTAEELGRAQQTRNLLLDLSVEFFDATREPSECIAEAKSLESVRCRAALRLVPQPKIGFEHVYFEAMRRLQEACPWESA